MNNKLIRIKMTKSVYDYKKGQVYNVDFKIAHVLFNTAAALLVEDNREKSKEEVLADMLKKDPVKLEDFEELKKDKLYEAIERITDYIDYLDLARQFYKIQPFIYDKQKIWWMWDFKDSSWNIIDETDLMNRIDDALQNKETTKSKVKGEIIESLQRIGRRNLPEPLPINKIQFKEKLFDINTKEISLVDPSMFATNPIPYDIGKTEETPVMDNLFKEWVGPEYVKTLYEIIAYCCYRDYPIHLIFCLIGGGRNGKSRFLALITKFIGKKNICSTELDTLLDSRFESFKLYKKLACTMGETNFGLLIKTSLLKRLCGQDMIGYEFKNKQPFDDFNYAKILISSNALPSSADTSEGFYRRWLIVDFPNTFREGKDILETIPEIEFNNLARKVIRIIPELLEKRIFHKQGSVEQRQQRYIAASNPLSHFIEKHCRKGTELYMKYSELYLAYIQYLLNNKRRKISRKEFKNVLDDEGLDVSKTTKYEGDTPINGYFIDGIEMKGYEEETIDDNNDNNAVNPTQ